MHNIGGPVLWLLPYALLGRMGVLLFMSIITVLIVVNIYCCLLSIGISERSAFLAGLAYGLASPLTIYAHLSFVEPLGALIVIYLLRLLLAPELKIRQVVLGALLLSLLPWVHIRFALVEIPLFLLLLYKLLRTKQWRTLSCYLAAFLLLFLGYELYNLLVWGTLNPGANQMNNNTAPFEKLPFEGLLGVFFDQEYGLLINFPVFLLAIAGLLLMLRRRFIPFHLLVLAIALPYMLGFTTLRHWTGGWCPPARFMLILLPLFSLYLGYALEHIQSRVGRVVFKLTCVYGFLYAIASILPPHNGFNAGVGHNNTLAFLQLFGHRLSDLLPSMFLPDESWLLLVWIGLFIGGAFLLVRTLKGRPLAPIALNLAGVRETRALGVRGRETTSSKGN